MKFNWGTGVALFLLLFTAAMIAFVVFAWQQDVNLVHRNYYEKGVDYSAQMDKEKRSSSAAVKISATEMNDSIRILFKENLSTRVDSGFVLFFRPSDHHLDVSLPIRFTDSTMVVGKEKLIPGRYIIKINWWDDGEEYEVDKTIIIN